MSIKLPDLPYAPDALAPHVSAETLEFHHGKHHRAYVDKTNDLVKDTPLDDQDLVGVITHARERADVALLNNAEQAWNHTFLWQSMTPGEPGRPDSRMAKLIDQAFGGLEGFNAAFRKSATGQFGSGWTWLVLDGSRLRIMNTSNADSPVATHLEPLLTLDVWEHAYYIDYRNARARYVDNFLAHLINWKFAASNLEALSEAA